ncbi:HET-E protein, partial [Linnemannia elongata AG-77]
MIALGEYDGDIEVIDTINWNRKYLLSGHSRNTTSLAFSPDSRRLVSGGHDAELRLWDLTKGECLFVMEEHENWVNEVRFSPCGKKIASASHDYTVRIWDADTGKRLHVLEGHTHYVLSIDFSPNGRRLGSGGEDGTLRFWDVETGDAEALGLLAVLEGHVGKILNLAYSPNGELLVTAGEDHTVRVWDAATGTQVSLFTDHGGYVNFCKFSSDGQRIASGGDDRRLRLWDVFGSGTPTTGAGYFGHLSCVNKVNYTPDGKSLFSCSGIGEVRNWVASTGAAGPVRIEGIANLLATAISPDGKIFAGGGRDRDDSTIIQLWDCRTGATLRALEGHDAFIYDLAFSPCGRYMASASVDQTAYLWDLQDKDSKPHTLVKLDQNNSDCPRFVAFSPMADKLAIGFRNSAIHLYNHRTKHFLKTFQGDRFSLGSMAFSPCGRQMVLGTSINSLYLWD